MKKFSGLLLFALLSMVSWVGSAAVVPPTKVVLRAYLDLDAEGKVIAMEWPRMDAKSKPLTDRIENAVSRWEFEPGSVDGVPVATRTGLTLVIGVGQSQRGAPTLSILMARTGAVVDQMVVPRYPMEQAKAGNTAALTLLLDVDDKGTVVGTTVTSYQSRTRSSRVPSGKSPKVRAAFEEASRAAAMLWKFSPERVAGRALPSKLEVPFDFCMDNVPCNPQRDDNEKAEDARLPSGTAIALDSVVKIKTQTDLTEI